MGNARFANSNLDIFTHIVNCVPRLSAAPMVDVRASRPSRQHTERAYRPWWSPKATTARQNDITVSSVEFEFEFTFTRHVCSAACRGPMVDVRAYRPSRQHTERASRPWWSPKAMTVRQNDITVSSSNSREYQYEFTITRYVCSAAPTAPMAEVRCICASINIVSLSTGSNFEFRVFTRMHAHRNGLTEH